MISAVSVASRAFYLGWLWFIASYFYDVISVYEKFYEYLMIKPDIVYTSGVLKKGHWISRSMGRNYYLLNPVAYLQHHGIVVEETEEEPIIAHFQDNKIKRDRLSDYMDKERIINVYGYNSFLKEPDDKYKSWEGTYNIISNNCECFASHMCNGIKHSKQVDVVEYIAYNRLWRSNPYPPEEYKLNTIARYYYNSKNE